MMLTMILLPALAALALPFLKCRRDKHRCVMLALTLEAVLAANALLLPEREMVLFSMTQSLTIALRLDGISKLFMAIGAFGFLLTGIYAFRYLEGEERSDRFFVFFLLSLAALMGMDFSRNLITMYLFFEMITLLSMPLVLYDRTEQAVRGAL